MWKHKGKWEWAGRAGRERGSEEGAESASEWVKRRLELAVDAQQAAVLDTKSRRGILNCSRQWGKWTVTAAKAIHHAVHVPDSLTVVVSPSGRQSAEFLRKVGRFARKLGQRVKGDLLFGAARNQFDAVASPLRPSAIRAAGCAGEDEVEN